MTNMPKAPLIYTFGVVRFPRVPDIGRFADGFLDLVRDDYPAFDEFVVPVVNASISPQGGMRIEQHETKMLQYATPDRKWAFLLTEEVMGLHTVGYVNHDDFVARFKVGLDALIGVPDLKINWLEAIGIRYVDLVVPREGEKLSDYLNPWVLPPDAPSIQGGMRLREGMYVAAYQTDVGELRFQSLRNPPTTLPMELDSPAVQRNGWKLPLPEGDFALMDMDHGCRFETLQPIDSDMVCNKLLELRAVAKDLFMSTGTPFAMKIWEGEA